MASSGDQKQRPFMEALCKIAEDQQLHDLLLWKDTFRSGIVFAFVNVTFYHLIFNQSTVLSLCLFLAAVHLACSVLFVVAGSFIARFQGSETTSTITLPPLQLPEEIVVTITRSFVVSVNAGLEWYRGAQAMSNIGQTAGVLVGLWIASSVLNWVSGMAVLYLVFLSAFVLPLVYSKHHTVIDAQRDALQAQISQTAKQGIAAAQKMLSPNKLKAKSA